MPYQNRTRLTVFFIAISFLFLAISAYQGIRCVSYKMVLATQSPIDYSILRKHYESSDKGIKYKLFIQYNGKQYGLSISGSSFNDIEQLPLYYDSTFDSVFCEWTIHNLIESLIGPLVFFIISVLVSVHFVRKNKREAQKQYSFEKTDTTLGQYKKISMTPFLFGIEKFLYQEVSYDNENLFAKSGKVVRTVPLSSITTVKNAWSKTNHIPIWKIEWNNNGKYGSVRFPIGDGFEGFFRFLKYYYPDVIKSEY